MASLKLVSLLFLAIMLNGALAFANKRSVPNGTYPHPSIPDLKDLVKQGQEYLKIYEVVLNHPFDFFKKNDPKFWLHFYKVYFDKDYLETYYRLTDSERSCIVNATRDREYLVSACNISASLESKINTIAQGLERSVLFILTRVKFYVETTPLKFQDVLKSYFRLAAVHSVSSLALESARQALDKTRSLKKDEIFDIYEDFSLTLARVEDDDFAELVRRHPVFEPIFGKENIYKTLGAEARAYTTLKARHDDLYLIDKKNEHRKLFDVEEVRDLAQDLEKVFENAGVNFQAFYEKATEEFYKLEEKVLPKDVEDKIKAELAAGEVEEQPVIQKVFLRSL